MGKNKTRVVETLRSYHSGGLRANANLPATAVIHELRIEPA